MSVFGKKAKRPEDMTCWATIKLISNNSHVGGDACIRVEQHCTVSRCIGIVHKAQQPSTHLLAVCTQHVPLCWFVYVLPLLGWVSCETGTCLHSMLEIMVCNVINNFLGISTQWHELSNTQGIKVIYSISMNNEDFTSSHSSSRSGPKFD
ncbi:hypothetical protein HELRODRAFT_183723 [Helobdella robusta]|uniref:Uncharacterized protein n=1 Tax=Helobdella robusta TaxID=6412 RepID=T1FK40_HELRO|nr:hypothetical protein HELRODRAFT_183723 [Helobdella robusta]ESO10351.1 hypothetical protein HELRODRAFT_183723 [Helobdella robusta]